MANRNEIWLAILKVDWLLHAWMSNIKLFLTIASLKTNSGIPIIMYNAVATCLSIAS